MGLGNPLAAVPFIVGARRTTKRYLAKRGLPRPAIPWAKIKEAKARAEDGATRAVTLARMFGMKMYARPRPPRAGPRLGDPDCDE